MKNILFLSAFLFFCHFSGTAQTDSLKKADRYYRHDYENDFFTATDRYYTQGVYMELILPVFKKTLLAKTLIPLNPRFGKTDKKVLNYYGVGLERQGFTPKTIRYDGIFYGERPYAAVLYITHSLASIDVERQWKLTTRINIGCMGPNLRGAEEQKAIHRSLVNIQPLGWENQIENDYVLNYDLFIEKGLISTRFFEMTASAEASAGTLYDDLGIGSMIRIGLMQPYFNNLGTTRDKTAKKFQCYLFARGKIKAVGYNATMQGGVFNRNSVYTIPAEDIERLVGIVYYGIAIAYKRVSLEQSIASITPEFKGGLSHGWGRFGINICF